MNEVAPSIPAASALLRTVSGEMLDLLAPDWKQVKIGDIAHGLARIRRFNAQTRRPISVAEHSMSVAVRLAPRLALAGLLHDGHEYVIGDIVTPTARALDALLGRDSAFGFALAGLKWGWDLAIARAVLEALAPRGATPKGGLLHQALLLTRAMHSPPVRLADLEAFLAEQEEFQGAPRVGRNAPSAASLKAPDEANMANRFARALRDGVAAWLRSGE